VPELRVIEVAREMREASRELARAGRSVGFVPTLGALHEGHLSLVRRARAENDAVVASIYVNPTQFGEGEDFERYPRSLEKDLDLLRGEDADIAFCPANAEMYPPNHSTFVEVGYLSNKLCGLSRPGHFRGVATVCAKLFHLVRPTRAYFGRKDAQQALLLRRMVRDLLLDLEIVVCPIVREADGLAISSRNANLSPEERAQATCLSCALEAAREALAAGETDAMQLIEIMAQRVISEPAAELDYAAIVDPEDLEDVREVDRECLAALAVWFGSTRLIDNATLGRAEKG